MAVRTDAMTEDELVREKVRRLWTNEREAERAREILSSFGTAVHEREVGRVQLAALKLSNGSLPELEKLIRAAREPLHKFGTWRRPRVWVETTAARRRRCGTSLT